MSATIIDGKQRAAEVRAELKRIVAGLTRPPKAAVILVGDHPASQIYVRHKKKAAEEVGLDVDVFALSPVMTEDALISFIRELNNRSDIDGIMVQLPLPAHINAYRVVESIHPDKDVDGLCSRNLGCLFTGYPALVPCTPLACLDLIRRTCPVREGLHAVVVGRSCLVGRPLAQLLLMEQCTVTQAHSRTRNLATLCRTADILISAAGHAGLITRDHVKPGAVVIDVGINRGPDGILCGDVDFRGVSDIAGAITPVPGGVGPMTVAMLLKNIVSVYMHTKNEKNA